MIPGVMGCYLAPVWIVKRVFWNVLRSIVHGFRGGMALSQAPLDGLAIR